MGTIFRTKLETEVNKCCQDPAWCYLLSNVLNKLDSGFYDKELVEVIFQYPDIQSLTIYDAYAFIHVWNLIGSAEIVMASLEVGKFPKNDKCIEDNNKAIQLLDGNYAGVFYGGTQSEDGYIEVKKPIVMNMKSKRTDKWVAKYSDGYFPLEVGFTNSEKTMYSMMDGGGRLARWCYGSDKIYLMERIWKKGII